jgi:hypothetical protein
LTGDVGEEDLLEDAILCVALLCRVLLIRDETALMSYVEHPVAENDPVKHIEIRFHKEYRP